ncbi:MAG: MFS transporter [Propionicimonas sp.]|nr:MFS transporter [Propionicimonas sp.]
MGDNPSGTGATVAGRGPARRPPSAVPAPNGGAFRPHPLGGRFNALLASTGLANVGDGILQVGAPLVAVTLTRSPAEVSLLTAAAWLPWLVLGIPSGALVDRIDRRHAQVAALATRAVILAAGAVVAASGRLSIPVILLVVLLYGVTDVVSDLGQTSIVPDLVARDRLSAANGRVLAVQQVAGSFLGAPVAGFLVALGTWSIFGVPAALGALAAVALLTGVRGYFRHAPADGPRPGVLTEVREGLAMLVRHPVLRPTLIAGTLFNMGSTAFMAVLVLWAVGPGSAMGLSSPQYALLMTAFALGAVGGSVVAERVISRVGEVRVLVWSFLLGSVLFLLPLLVPRFWPVAVGLVVMGAGNNVGNVVSQSLRQRLVPRHMLGRIAGAGRAVSYGLMPVGALLGGAVGELWGLPASLLAGTAFCLASTLVLALFLRQRDVDAHEPPVGTPIE